MLATVTTFLGIAQVFAEATPGQIDSAQTISTATAKAAGGHCDVASKKCRESLYKQQKEVVKALDYAVFACREKYERISAGTRRSHRGTAAADAKSGPCAGITRRFLACIHEFLKHLEQLHETACAGRDTSSARGSELFKALNAIVDESGSVPDEKAVANTISRATQHATGLVRGITDAMNVAPNDRATLNYSQKQSALHTGILSAYRDCINLYEDLCRVIKHSGANEPKHLVYALDRAESNNKKLGTCAKQAKELGNKISKN
ncbi:hypothetical protein PAPHI01_0881 [Pancytospora philotis]|nr:hypothetical protein PAPHI01_0881 [Pancytospora philotis]